MQNMRENLLDKHFNSKEGKRQILFAEMLDQIKRIGQKAMPLLRENICGDTINDQKGRRPVLFLPLRGQGATKKKNPEMQNMRQNVRGQGL
jgi:hypothetical protein